MWSNERSFTFQTHAEQLVVEMKRSYAKQTANYEITHKPSASHSCDVICMRFVIFSLVCWECFKSNHSILLHIFTLHYTTNARVATLFECVCQWIVLLLHLCIACRISHLANRLWLSSNTERWIRQREIEITFISFEQSFDASYAKRWLVFLLFICIALDTSSTKNRNIKVVCVGDFFVLTLVCSLQRTTKLKTSTHNAIPWKHK